ncbi:MAG: putative selenate reductase subunit YgfK [Bacteroidetes bacterium]|nr:putative selenate reductase subunit YgfK [Bacteroidota bacterium]
MSDRFSPISIRYLFYLLAQGEVKNNIFGIPRELCYLPSAGMPYSSERFEKRLDAPVGVAAGPHTQLAQNIITAWLCGARFIELKTIQTLDELNIPKPCIDMQDEGYNREWSQELKIRQSFDQYLNAWILIHLLHKRLGMPDDPGTIFNMSVGYNLEGIQKENVQWFFEKMKDCSIEKNEKIEALAQLFPAIGNLVVPDRISDNVTLSTMHGCPPDEIEKIGRYLVEEKKLHTILKLNPTLLGPDQLREILNGNLGFNTEVPDIAFEHDLKYQDAVPIIKSLQQTANHNGVRFGIKLTNTLECINNRDVFGSNAEMMYMSGRALHPIAIGLARKLQNDFGGKLDISFSAGADCFNIADIIACGLKPVTVSSDLLKPGGYGRIKQYIQALDEAFAVTGATDIDDFILKTDGTGSLKDHEAALLNLNKYASDVLKCDAYKKHPFHTPSVKTNRSLGAFDCIYAPCVTACQANQDIPEYMYYTSKGEFEKAFRVIMRSNPFPSVLGTVCDHLCRSKCTRINYDDSLLIREIKRFVTEHGKVDFVPEAAPPNGLKAAIIGAGPSGLSCAHFLALSGFEVNVYETKDTPGGMLSGAIPAFRLGSETIKKDIERIEKSGVKIHYNTNVDAALFEKLRSTNDYIYISVGAQQAKQLAIEGASSAGVLDPLCFLSACAAADRSDIRNERKVNPGRKIVIIGGGNTAMDAARAVLRVAGGDSSVTILYRRTCNEMPAGKEELEAAIREGIIVQELVSPEKIISENGKVTGIVCSRMKSGDKDESGRARPVKIDGSEFTIVADTVIPAIGQDVVIGFADTDLLSADTETFETKIKNVYIGGDSLRGASTIVQAVADGRKVAEKIIGKAEKQYCSDGLSTGRKQSPEEHVLRRAARVRGVQLKGKEQNTGISRMPLPLGMNDEEAIEEASRCLFCDEYCSICETVCPNRANYTYRVTPGTFRLQKAIKSDNQIRIEDDEPFSVRQEWQVLNIGDFCNECGNCTTFCPTSGAPYRDKPTLYLSFGSFNAAGNGYFINSFGGNTTIMHRNGNSIKTLTPAGDIYLFDTDKAVAKLKKEDFSIIDISFKDPALKEFRLTDAVTMSILLEAAKDIHFMDGLFGL